MHGQNHIKFVSVCFNDMDFAHESGSTRT